MSKIYVYEGLFRYHLNITREKKGKLVKTILRKIFPNLNIYGKLSNVSVIETKAVKIKVTIKCDMKAMSNIFS